MSRTVADAHAPGPGSGQRPAWRAALSVYRRRRLEGHYDWECVQAGVEAYLAEAPQSSIDEAQAEMVRAIHWASVNHRAWLYPRNADGSSAGIPNPYQRHWLRSRGLDQR